ncbi:MAG: biotin/lipoyl-containing protein [Anaerotignum sp.]
MKKNQPLLTVEAMKMETSIVANQDGVIDKIYAKEGEKVNQGDLLVSFVQEA